jgi:outer membrane protein assembly factor BamB
VIQPIEDGRVFALDRATAAVKWVAPRVHNVSVSLQDVRYVSAGATVALVTSDAVPGGIVAYDVATGTELWRRMENGGSLYPPVLDATNAYVDHGWVFASYDLATGATRWQTPQSQWHHPEAPYKGRPIIAGDRIYVAGYDGSYALRP